MTDPRRESHETEAPKRKRYPFMHGFTIGAGIATYLTGFVIAYLAVTLNSALLGWFGLVCIAVGGLVALLEDQGYGWP